MHQECILQICHDDSFGCVACSLSICPSPECRHSCSRTWWTSLASDPFRAVPQARKGQITQNPNNKKHRFSGASFSRIHKQHSRIRSRITSVALDFATAGCLLPSFQNGMGLGVLSGWGLGRCWSINKEPFSNPFTEPTEDWSHRKSKILAPKKGAPWFNYNYQMNSANKFMNDFS